MTTEVSVIYVNYNCTQLIIESAGSLEKHCKGVPFEIIVVDNDSREEEKQLLTSWGRTTNTRITFASNNLGFGKANNLGARLAIGNYLLFLNPDTLIQNNVLGIFHEFMKAAGFSAAACGAKLLTSDGKPNSSYGNFPSILQEICHIGFGLSALLGGYYKRKIAIGAVITQAQPLEVPYIVGADIFIRRSIFLDVGGFDEGYFMYYEETDLFRTLSKRNYSSYIVPEAKIIHLDGAVVGRLSNGTFNYSKFTMLLESKLYYYRKWFGSIYLPFFKLLFFMQILVQFVKGNMGSSISTLLKIYFAKV